jgi:hypothetical protein
MPNPPSITLSIPYVSQAVGVIVNSNGVQPDGTNPGVPDTTSPLVISTLSGGAFFSAVVDPGNNRRIIVSGVAPPVAANSIQQWSFKVAVAGKPAFVTVNGTTQCPSDVSGVRWDEIAVGPA